MSTVHKRKGNSSTIKNSFDDKKDQGQNGLDLEQHLLPILLLVRLVNVFLVRTSFVPDEYWQSLEVAHKSVFGYGYLAWEWKSGLRSYAYPAVFAAAYHTLELLGMDNGTVLVYAPRIMHAVLSAYGDWCLYHFAKKYFGSQVAKYVLFSCITTWFWWYCATRTLINTLEASALCIGFYYYPWQNDAPYSKIVIYEVLAISITVLRPTAVVVWVPLALWHLYRTPEKIYAFFSYVFWTIFVLLLSTVLDRIYYGEWVSVHWNFFTFNILKNLSALYGTHPWHWYLSQGIPVVLGPQIIFFLHGAYSASVRPIIQEVRISRCLMALFLFTVFPYSFIQHKEFRFILHLVPIASIFCGMSFSKLSQKWQRYGVQFLLITNVPTALYFGLIHQSGPLTITNNLRGMLASSCNPECPGGVLYLTPCHSTPVYSHLHVNVTLKFLDSCPPDFMEEEDYQVKADRFYENPPSWLDENIFRKNDERKSLQNFNWIVIYDSLYEEIQNHNPLENYEICNTEFHSHFPENRQGKYLHILCKKLARSS